MTASVLCVSVYYVSSAPSHFASKMLAAIDDDRACTSLRSFLFGWVTTSWSSLLPGCKPGVGPARLAHLSFPQSNTIKTPDDDDKADCTERHFLCGFSPLRTEKELFSRVTLVVNRCPTSQLIIRDHLVLYTAVVLLRDCVREYRPLVPSLCSHVRDSKSG